MSYQWHQTLKKYWYCLLMKRCSSYIFGGISWQTHVHHWLSYFDVHCINYPNLSTQTTEIMSTKASVIFFFYLLQLNYGIKQVGFFFLQTERWIHQNDTPNTVSLNMAGISSNFAGILLLRALSGCYQSRATPRLMQTMKGGRNKSPLPPPHTTVFLEFGLFFLSLTRQKQGHLPPGRRRLFCRYKKQRLLEIFFHTTHVEIDPAKGKTMCDIPTAKLRTEHNDDITAVTEDMTPLWVTNTYSGDTGFSAVTVSFLWNN